MEKKRNRKWLYKLLAILAGGFVIANLATCFFLDFFIFHPKKLPSNYSFSFDFPFEEFTFETEPGISINCLKFPSATDTTIGVILYFHGNADNLQRWGRYSVDFTQYGYDVVMMDYRGFGKSTGAIYTEEVFFQDTRMFYNEVISRYQGTQIIIYGRSLGTAVATQLASQVPHKKLILETPFYSMEDLIFEYAPFLPKSTCVKYHFRSDVWMENVKSPVFIFHGTHDKVVPYTQGQKFKFNFGEQVELITIPKGRHKNLRKFPEYHEAMGRVL